jgi:hypothetical protein
MALFLSTQFVWAGRNETMHFSFTPEDDIEALEVRVDLGAGEFRIMVEEMDEVAIADVEYNDRKVEVYADYDERGKTGIVEFESDYRRKFSVDTEDNRWDIILSDKYPTELEIDIGACEADFDLGGLPLEFLDLDVGATDGEITFSRPNPISTEEIIIDAGAADFRIKKLGNANFRRMTFDGGVGDFEIDFSGDLREKARVDISIGLGSATLYIPRDLPVRIEADDSFLSSVDFEGPKRGTYDDDYYETDDYNDADYGLDIEISVGLGAVDIIFED